jgi:hypothetical protein
LGEDARAVGMPWRTRRRIRLHEEKETRWITMLRIFGINPGRLVILVLLLTASLILVVRAMVMS